MPDLTIINVRACKDLEYLQCKIDGSNGNKYNVCYDGMKWHCECKSFKFRKSCKHVVEACKKQCTWTEQTGEAADKECCPECGGETFIFRMGV